MASSTSRGFTVGIDRWKVADTCQNAETRKADQQIFNKDAGTSETWTGEKSKKTSLEDTNRDLGVASQGWKSRKDVKTGYVCEN